MKKRKNTLIKAELKDWSFQDIEDPEGSVPEQGENFNFLFRAYVGPVGEECSESVDIQICSPMWLQKNLGKDEIICARHYLILREYNLENILNKVKELIESCSGKDWQEVGEKLSRIGAYEFEDYQEYKTKLQ